MVGDFRARLEALDGALHEVGDVVAARELASALVGVATVARWDDLLLAEVAGRDADPRVAEVSLVVADVGVADTGAVGFAHGPGRSRATGLLPDRQIALLARTDLVRSTGEALARWFGAEGLRNGPPGNVVFAAGPSRTADIEQTTMLGVHAPRSLDVVLYG